MITFSLTGKRALVTGAAQGIGYGVAEAFAAQGAAVAILDVNADHVREAAAALARSTGTEVIGVTADVRDPASVETAIDEVTSRRGGLDVAVNNAGVGNATSVLGTTDEEWRRVYDVNVDGVFYCCRAEGRWMLENSVPGSIINTVSMSAFVSVPQHQTPYNSSKSAALGLTKSLANELAPAGIRVNSVSPGFTLTPMVKTERMRPQHELWTSLTPAGRLAEVEDLVGAYVFLASDASRFMVGHDLLIDGGYTLR
ncbi:MAG: SDR family NAD(P)-dependent oxidoreductase [Propionibacteriaceae bacterium]